MVLGVQDLEAYFFLKILFAGITRRGGVRSVPVTLLYYTVKGHHGLKGSFLDADRLACKLRISNNLMRKKNNNIGLLGAPF